MHIGARCPLLLLLLLLLLLRCYCCCPTNQLPAAAAALLQAVDLQLAVLCPPSVRTYVRGAGRRQPPPPWCEGKGIRVRRTQLRRAEAAASRAQLRAAQEVPSPCWQHGQPVRSSQDGEPSRGCAARRTAAARAPRPTRPCTLQAAEMHEEMLRKTFDKYDKDKSGAISTRELREFMQEIMGEKVRTRRAATPPPTTQKRVARSCTARCSRRCARCHRQEAHFAVWPLP